MKITPLSELGRNLLSPIEIGLRGRLTHYGSLVPECGNQFFNIYGIDSDPETFFFMKIGDPVTSRTELRKWFMSRGKNQNTATTFYAFEVSKKVMRDFLNSLITVNRMQESAVAVHKFARLSEGLTKDPVVLTAPGITTKQSIAYLGNVPIEEWHEHFSDAGSGNLFELRQHILWSIEQTLKNQ